MLVALCSRVSMGLSITIGATALGTVALAANQVVESVYWLFCPIGEAISLCMQTYLPSVLAARRRAGAQMRRRCERASTCAGLVAGAAAGLSVVVRPGLFTTCGAVAGSMARAAPALAAAIFTFTRMCGLEGSMIARKQMKQLALTHATLAVVLIAALRRATRTAGCGLQHVWGIIVLLNAARTLIFRQVVRRAEVAETLSMRRRGSRRSCPTSQRRTRTCCERGTHGEDAAPRARFSIFWLYYDARRSTAHRGMAMLSCSGTVLVCTLQ